jgi:8-amino-7-oxononanoate synthase
MHDLANQLAARRAQGLYRERLLLDSPQGVQVRVGHENLLAFCSNDYLALANDARVVEAFCAASRRYGVGAGASHLISGHTSAHHGLERELAEFVGAPRALVFSTGYMANLGVVSALTDRHSVIFEDKLNHASLIDAARLSQATVRRYPHVDMGRLAELLARTQDSSQRSTLITTDAVFSMDGDIAPLAELAALTKRHDVWLLADDAHGLGVLGRDGSGSFARAGVMLDRAIALMGTLGKALGVFGAFVAGSEELIETLVQKARTYIYTTALPPAVAEATRAALCIARAEQWRRDKLNALVRQFVDGARGLGLRLSGSSTPIQPVVLGSAERVLAASRALRRQGILVPSIRPPTVPANTARLRITFSAAHEPEQVDRLLEALSHIAVAR